jgi:hypothetical protein
MNTASRRPIPRVHELGVNPSLRVVRFFSPQTSHAQWLRTHKFVAQSNGRCRFREQYSLENL